MKNRLRELREYFNLSQKKLGEKLNLSVSQISSYETGHRNIPERTILDICRIFKCNKEWFVNGAGDMFIDDLEDLDVEEDIKILLSKLKELDEEDRVAIQKMIDNAYYKVLSNKKERDEE